MRPLKIAITLLALFVDNVVAASIDASQAERIAKKSLCLGCHAIDQKAVGPSFKLIAQKYKNNPSAQAILVPKVKNGGVGSWGVVAMPANAKHINDDDLRIVLTWILAGAPTEKK